MTDKNPSRFKLRDPALKAKAAERRKMIRLAPKHIEVDADGRRWRVRRLPDGYGDAT